MKVVTLNDIPNVPVEGADRIEGWTGPVSRSRQTIIEPERIGEPGIGLGQQHQLAAPRVSESNFRALLARCHAVGPRAALAFSCTQP